MENVLKTNKITVTGELVETNLEIRQSKANGNDFISGNIVLKSIINNREQLTELQLYSSSVKKDGTPNKFFETYSSLENKIGKRFTVSGEIEEGRYYQDTTGQVISFNRNVGRFVNDARANEADQAKFEFAGYVVKPITERLNKDGELLFHEITFGQANYAGTKPILVKFVVTDPKIANAVQGLYEKGVTAKVSGDVSIVTEEREYTEDSAFGDPIVKTSVRTYRNFIITSGTQPAEMGAYSPEDIITLDSAYMDETAQLEAEAREGVQSGVQATTNSQTTAKKGLNSLLL